MKTSLLLLLILLVGAGAANAERKVQGVPWDAVDWEKLCKSVKPLQYTSSTGQVCPKVHPADPIWRKWSTLNKNKSEPKWRCEAKAKRYERQVKSIEKCKRGFSAALNQRAHNPNGYNEPLAVWRSRYFGEWMSGD